MAKAAKLVEAARAAAEVRTHQTDPNVVALHVERIRGWVDRLIWTGMVLGLLFTMANVQHFAAGDTLPPWAPGVWKNGAGIDWIIAWLLDPMVSLVVIGVLMGEQVINRHNIKAGDWVRVTKWVALGCTYAMNTWSAWQALDPARIVLHSVPPLIVVCAAEAGPTLRRQITEAVAKAYEGATEQSQAQSQAPAAPPAEAPVSPPVEAPVEAPVGAPVTPPVERLPERLSTACQTPAQAPAGPPALPPVKAPADRPKRTRQAIAPKAPKAKKLTPEEVKAKAWEHLKENPEMSAPELARALGKSPTSGHVRDLKAKVLEEMRDAGELPSVRAIGA